MASLLNLPGLYTGYITRNAHQVTQIESALRSLTYIIPGRFRDAEIASESVHSLVQVLSLYHDGLLLRAVERLRAPSPHGRYTAFWTAKSAIYRRVATLLQLAAYVQLLVEMAARRRGGEKGRWAAVVVVEGIKALCRLLLLRTTRSRPVMTSALPERPPLPSGPEDEDDGAALRELMGEETLQDLLGPGSAKKTADWRMPRTRMNLPTLPQAGDISAYLQARVLTADDIKPAPSLLGKLHKSGQAAEMLHILAPFIFAVLSARNSLNPNSKQSRLTNWSPWLAAVGCELVARRLRANDSRMPQLERDEWSKRAWALPWWALRGAAYEAVAQPLVQGVRARVPRFVGGILEDYEYLWQNYYFSTST